MFLLHIKDLYLHQEWADSKIWQAVLSSEKACSDTYVLDTLIHLHEAQHGFLNVWTAQPFVRRKRDDFGSSADLCRWAKQFHSACREYLYGLSATHFSQVTNIPWAKYFTNAQGVGPYETTLLETMHQVISHSMHHRGQVARRLRELGVQVPLTDYIVWVWEGRSSSIWPARSE